LTIWIPDTCACECDVENQILLQKCRSHDNYRQTLTHNQSFNRPPGRSQEEKDTERSKPEFQRR